MGGFGVYSPGGYSLSAKNASGTGSAIDLRASNGNFMLIISASGGASAGASATLQPQHSHDLVAWTNLGALLTASAGAQPFLTASFSAGAYAYVRVNTTAVFSAAQTGTGTIWAYILPGKN